MIKSRTAAPFVALIAWLAFAAPALAGMVPSQSLAQTTPAAPPKAPGAEAAAPRENPVEGWNRVLDGIQQGLAREGITDEQLAQFSRETADIRQQATKLIGDLTPKVAEIQQQITELGPAPVEGAAPEAEAVAAKRKSLQDALAATDGPLKEARLVTVRTDQVDSTILTTRRDRFLRSLTRRTRSVLDTTLWTDSIAGLPHYAKGFVLVIRDSMVAIGHRIADKPSSFLLLMVQVLAGCAVFWYVHRMFRSRAKAPPPEGEAATPVRATRHLADFIRNGVLPALLLLFIGRMVIASEFVGARFGQILSNAVITFSALFVTFALLRIFLRPVRPELRIAELSDGAARSAFTVGAIALVAVSVLRILDVSAVLLLAPFEVSIALGTILALVCIIATVRVMMVIAADRAGREEAGIVANQRLIRWRYVRALLWLAILASSGALLFGFVALAEFIWYEIIVTLTVVGVLWLIMRWIDEAKRNLFEPGQRVFERMAATTGISTSAARQSAVLGFGFLRLITAIAAIGIVLLTWGVQTADWLVWVHRFFFGFQVGQLTISVSGILTALVLFIVGVVITKTVQQWVATQYLPTTNLDTGLRNSITTILGYVGFVLAAVLAIGSAGLDLSNIALVAGALSVGIGLGLQSIVNNFVSGLILLAERPIKAGDWIITAAGEGTVRRISVRSTEIETFDRATVIVPNSTLITDSLTNWTHRSKVGRIIVTIGVGYDSDPDEVRRILLACAEDHETILKRPEPMVYFMDFGDSALVFDLRAWVADIGDGFEVKSDLRFEILRRLRAAGIEIPFPQRDLHIRSGLDALAAAGRKPEPGPTPKRARRGGRDSAGDADDG